MKKLTISIDRKKTNVVSNITPFIKNYKTINNKHVYFDNDFNNNDKINIVAKDPNTKVSIVKGFYVPKKKILLIMSKESTNYMVNINDINEAIDIIKSYNKGSYNISPENNLVASWK